jgi:hypothetical protein
MSRAKQFLCSKLECSLFNQIVLFSLAGLSVSLTLASVYDLQIASAWF